MARLIVRQLDEKDFMSYKQLFDEAYYEYLEGLKQSNLQQYRKELQDQRKVTSSRFIFYLNTGSSFVAQKNGEVVGYVATQTISYMRGFDRVLWIEYIVTKRGHRRQGIATALPEKLKDYAEQHQIDSIFATINPDNAASIKLHREVGFKVKNWKTATIKTSG